MIRSRREQENRSTVLAPQLNAGVSRYDRAVPMLGVLVRSVM